MLMGNTVVCVKFYNMLALNGDVFQLHAKLPARLEKRSSTYLQLALIIKVLLLVVSYIYVTQTGSSIASVS